MHICLKKVSDRIVTSEEDITTIRVEKDTRADLEVYLRSRLNYNDLVCILLETVAKNAKLRDEFVSKLEDLNAKRSRGVR